MQEGFFGYYNPNNDRRKMSIEDQVAEDRCVVLNYFPDLTALSMIIPDDQLSGIMQRPHMFAGDSGLGLEFRRFYESRLH